MELANTFWLAIVAIGIGAVLISASMLSLRLVAAQSPHGYLASPVTLPVEADSDAGVLIARAGGRLEFINEHARKLFGLDGQMLDLEKMARQVRPSETFRLLFATEGTAQISIGVSGQQIEATSLRVPGDDRSPAKMVVLLRETGRLPELAVADERTAQAMSVIAEISRAIASSLDLNATFDAVLANVGRLLQYDVAEINLWDTNAQVLRPARYAGNRDYERLVRREQDFAYKPDESFSGWLATRRSPLRIGDIQSFKQVRPKVQRADFPFRSFLGVPLMVGQQLVGTLELISYQTDTYKPSDEVLLSAIAGQAAIAIQNAQLYAEQQRRVAELSGVAEITRAIETTDNPRELYGRLTADIARLMGVQMVGFLLYAENERALIAQPPFRGVPDWVLESYRIPIQPDSLIDGIWREAPYWLTNDVLSDPVIESIGLKALAETAGVRTTLIAPIAIGGRRVGVVQASNRVDQAPFDEGDARLLTIFAAQTAAILENARLVREAQGRAEQAEGLRQIAVTAAAGTDLDHILRRAMEQTAQLLKFDTGVVSLLDEARGELVPHPASIFGAHSDVAEARIRTDDPLFGLSVTRTRRAFISNRAQRDRRIVGVYRPVVERYQMNSVMDVPLVVGDQSLGEMIVAAQRENAFTRADLRLLSTIAAQLASAIERARLYAATDQNLQRRVDQLTALTRVSRELNQTLDRERVLRLVHSESITATRADGGAIVLLNLDPNRTSVVALRLGGSPTAVGLSSVEMDVALSSKPVRLHHLEPGAPQGAEHSDVRSVLVVPIVEQDTVVGLINLYSARPEAFDDTALETAMALAAQASIAVGNAQRYEEQLKRNELLRRRADQFSQLFEISRTVRSDRPLAENLESIAFGLQEASGFNVVVVNLIDLQTQLLKAAAAVGLPLAQMTEVRALEQPWENVRKILHADFRISQSYFLPHERSAELVQRIETLSMPSPARVPEGTPNRWDPQDMLVSPILGSGAEPLGLISLDDPRHGLRPDRTTIELIEIFANQATLAIENARLFEAAQRRAARLLALHRVIERAASLADRNKLSQTVSEALVGEMGFDLCLVALMEGSRFVVRGHAGAIRAEVDFEAVLSRQNPLAYIIAEGEPLLTLNVKGSEWAADPLVLALEVSSFLCAPIINQGQAIGALFVGSHKTPSPFADEDVELFIILSNQIGAALESFRLESDIRRRAAQLGALADASRTITATLRTDDVVQAVMSNLRSVVPYDSVTLWLRAGEELRIVAAQGFENDAERLGLTVNIADSALFAEMAQTGGAILVPDVRDDPRFPGGEFLPTRTWLGAPLISKGRIIGALTLDRIEAHSYSALTPQLLTAFANQAAVALDNARLFEENEERSLELDARTQRLARLNRVSDQLSRTLDVTAMYETLLREVMAALDVGQAALFTLGDDGAALALHEPAAGPAPTALTPVIMRMREALAPTAIEDVSQDALVADERNTLAARGVKSLLALPLIAAGTLVAVLHVEETRQRRRFTPSEIELAQTLANQTATAVQNARLLVEVQSRAVELSQRNERLNFLNKLATAMSATLDVDTILHQAAGQVVQLFQADHSSMFIFDEAAQVGTVEAEHPYLGALGQTLTLSADPLAHQILAHHVVIVEDLAADPRLGGDLRAHLAGMGLHAMLVAPLIAQGQVIGAFTLDSLSPRQFTQDDIELCQTIAAQIATSLYNAQFARDLEARVSLRTKEVQLERERVETLLQVTTELSSSLDLDRVLARALQLVTEAVNATQGSIFIIDLQTEQLMYRAALGSPKVLPPGGEPAPFKRGEGLVGWVIKSRQAVVVNNLETDTRWKKIPGQNVNHRSAIAVPIMWNEDVLGAILLFSPIYNAFDEEQLRLVSAAANQVGSATNNAELYRLIRDQAERLGNLLRAQQVETTKNRSILEGIADGVLVADAEGLVILFNAASERILGLNRDLVLGRPITEFVGIYGAAGRALIEAITSWSLDPAAYRPGEAFSQRLELEDQRIISVTLAPVMTGDEYLGSVSLLRDITREVEVDRLKSEFVTNVSHELRTPITPIKGYSDLLLKGMAGPLEPSQQKLVEIIKSNADRLKMLVDDILDISRVESGQLELSKRALDLSEIVNEVVENLRTQMAQTNKALTIVADVPASLPSVWGDQERITQIIMNLADNAFNYTPEGGAVGFHARLDEAKREVVLEVSDTGVGIPEEHRERLFDRFFRGENALVMATAGTGLGLSIARQLIEMQGGRIWLAHSDEGRGTTFAMALPVAVTETVKETA